MDTKKVTPKRPAVAGRTRKTAVARGSRVSKTKTEQIPVSRAAAKPADDANKRGYIQCIGRRKTAIARLRLYTNGNGSVTVNGKAYTTYFPYSFWQEIVISPLPLVGLAGAVDISVKVEGGGLPAQAEAVRLALTRALIIHNHEWRPTLRKMGWLTRDPREKERKKPGLKRARRGPQWAKR